MSNRHAGLLLGHDWALSHLTSACFGFGVQRALSVREDVGLAAHDSVRIVGKSWAGQLKKRSSKEDSNALVNRLKWRGKHVAQRRIVHHVTLAAAVGGAASSS